MGSVKVIHVKDIKEGDFFCGRESSFHRKKGIKDATVLGNPYFMADEGQRENVIFRYKKWLIEKMEKEGPVATAVGEIARVSQYSEVRLACFCSPKSCHCDVIKEMIELNLV